MTLPKYPRFIFFASLLILLTSCVTRKKYTALQKDAGNREQVFNAERSQYLVTNDSLKYVVAYKDALIDSLNNKLSDVLAKKEKARMQVINYKKSTLTKDQENEKKSLFIYNFTKHIEWPIEYNGTEFIIGVSGDDQTIKQLETFMNQKKVSGKKIVVEKYKKGARYNLVYITSPDSKSFETIKNAVRKNKTILVTDDYVQGSHIAFSVELDKVKYTVDKPEIEKTGLKVAQELIRYAGK
jgi:hypothetical protein